MKILILIRFININIFNILKHSKTKIKILLIYNKFININKYKISYFKVLIKIFIGT